MITAEILYTILRRLAKAHEYQSLYSNAKELNFKIFENNRNLSDFQIQFLGFLNFYATIYMDIYLKEVSERVLEHIIYEDSYTYYKSNKEKENVKPPKQTKNNQITKPVQKEEQVKSTWHFKKRR